MNDISWTSHADYKMKYYKLSKQKVSGVIRRPDRIEKGIAGGNTVAVMQAVSPKVKEGKKVWNQEIWTLYKEVTSEKKDANPQLQNNQNRQKVQVSVDKNNVSDRIAKLQNALLTIRNIRVISAWRYPGMSPKNKPLPDDILLEIEEMSL